VQKGSLSAEKGNDATTYRKVRSTIFEFVVLLVADAGEQKYSIPYSIICCLRRLRVPIVPTVWKSRYNMKLFSTRRLKV